MKELIEKLIERLGKLGWVYADYYPDETVIHRKRKKSVSYDDVISTVNKLVEEYKHCDLCYLGSPCEYQNPEISCEKCIEYDTEEHCCQKFCKVSIDTIQEMKEEYNNGWIPCSERLPEENGWYLVTNTLGVVQQQYWGARHWYKLKNEAVVAWMPLPAPYQPKGE